MNKNVLFSSLTAAVTFLLAGPFAIAMPTTLPSRDLVERAFGLRPSSLQEDQNKQVIFQPAENTNNKSPTCNPVKKYSVNGTTLGDASVYISVGICTAEIFQSKKLVELSKQFSLAFEREEKESKTNEIAGRFYSPKNMILGNGKFATLWAVPEFHFGVGFSFLPTIIFHAVDNTSHLVIQVEINENYNYPIFYFSPEVLATAAYEFHAELWPKLITKRTGPAK